MSTDAPKVSNLSDAVAVLRTTWDRQIAIGRRITQLGNEARTADKNRVHEICREIGRLRKEIFG
jgi:hypothetical protein